MKNEKSKKLTTISYGVSVAIFLAIFLWGKFFLDGGDEMGYVILALYMIMPLTSFITGIILGIKDAYLKWAYPIIFGALGFIIPGLVFKGSWDWFAIFFSLIPGLIGLLIGFLIDNFKKKA